MARRRQGLRRLQVTNALWIKGFQFSWRSTLPTRVLMSLLFDQYLFSECPLIFFLVLSGPFSTQFSYYSLPFYPFFFFSLPFLSVVTTGPNLPICSASNLTISQPSSCIGHGCPPRKKLPTRWPSPLRGLEPSPDGGSVQQVRKP